MFWLVICRLLGSKALKEPMLWFLEPRKKEIMLCYLETNKQHNLNQIRLKKNYRKIPKKHMKPQN